MIHCSARRVYCSNIVHHVFCKINDQILCNIFNRFVCTCSYFFAHIAIFSKVCFGFTPILATASVDYLSTFKPH